MNDTDHSLPQGPGHEFRARANGKGAPSVSVSESHESMRVCATSEVIYISKAQAMAFFDLVPRVGRVEMTDTDRIAQMAREAGFIDRAAFNLRRTARRCALIWPWMRMKTSGRLLASWLSEKPLKPSAHATARSNHAIPRPNAH